jgi:glycine/D-amino acid oxidase-like deaminating enzyme
MCNGSSARAARRPGSHTNRGTINAGQILNCTAGWSTLICDMVGVPLPITTHILQACVSEPVKPLLDVVVVSSQMHVYISQTDRGEFLMGAEIEPWTTYRMEGTLNFLQEVTRHTLELFPQLERARLLRSWAGLCDVSPDYSPILGPTEVENFHISAGWGTYGFKAAPIVGKTLAGAGRHRTHARADRAVPARAVLRRQARLRTCSRGRQPLEERGQHGVNHPRGSAHEDQPRDRPGSRSAADRADRRARRARTG